ncbi:sensor histidine kinase [Microbispora sp. ATCC PTA-5024]|uniref:sensor histidine kinase n=1 Tax=Microbispora sp. ATCC PTA-5024 TaxID=316330 RepID=UPI0003DC4B1D|nr:sensor histidine kinase [Microbispora sp. ATCC PTA-5024]ETK33902.1 histidine kinase [Microbispora sp. ATCC PTA-5024]
MFGRLRAWGAHHSALVDALTVSPVALICLLSASAFSSPGSPVHLGRTGILLLSLVLLVPLLWRRRYPREVFAVVALLCFGQWVADIQIVPADLAVLIAMYAVASRCAPRWAVAAGLVAEFGLLLAVVRWWGDTLRTLPSSSVFVVAIWIAGIYVSTRRRYVESLVERAERAERERDQQARIAASAERARIARELHDVVAHNVSVMVVQADGAAYAMDTDPDQTRRALHAISATGRQALAEMRRLVGVLRQDAGSPAEEYAPQPGVAQLAELVKQVTESGLPIEFAVSGTPRDLPEGEQLAIYRIVQEALTNTLKHGGPGARARVDVRFAGGQVELRIRDDGRGAAAPRLEGGHGLIGMRERVAMYGGVVEAAPSPGGGFQVVARIPVGVAA